MVTYRSYVPIYVYTVVIVRLSVLTLRNDSPMYVTVVLLGTIPVLNVRYLIRDSVSKVMK
jgi:hypothetical protein